MAKTITITGIKIRSIQIERDDQNNVRISVDYMYRDENGIPIDDINLQVSTESKPFPQYTAQQRDWLLAINNWVESKILTKLGV